MYKVILKSLPKRSKRQIFSKLGCCVVFLKYLSPWNGIVPSIRRTSLNFIVISSLQPFCRLVVDSLKMMQYRPFGTLQRIFLYVLYCSGNNYTKGCFTTGLVLVDIDERNKPIKHTRRLQKYNLSQKILGSIYYIYIYM